MDRKNNFGSVQNTDSDSAVILQATGFTSIDLYGTSISSKTIKDGRDVQADNCECFHLENESGVGDITMYQVFPGIELIYNDMHMAYCNKHQKPAADVMEMNCCLYCQKSIFRWRYCC